MTLEYTLEQPDFLEFQLFSASKSERIIKSRRNSRIRLPIVYFILGLVLLVLTDPIFALVFIGIGLAWYFLHPNFMRKRYVRHFEKYLHENYKNRFGKRVSLKFGDEFIESTDYLSESKMRIRELEEINEIKDYYFLKVSSGESFIIPKNRIKEGSEFHEYISKLTKDLEIKYNTELNWKWN